jgi:hypothetical protein
LSLCVAVNFPRKLGKGDSTRDRSFDGFPSKAPMWGHKTRGFNHKALFERTKPTKAPLMVSGSPWLRSTSRNSAFNW